jgi:hypothetical protein
MTEPVETSPIADLDRLHSRLWAAAAAVNFSPVDAPQLTVDVFKGGDASDVARLPPTDLPPTVRAMSFGRYSWLLGLLPDQPTIEAVNDCLRRFRNQCIVARSYLAPNEALDLQGILLGPRASEPDDDWKAVALTVERDDRVARKFVWLRPVDPAGDDVSFADVISRTVLARPWISEATFTMAALDNINRVAAQAQASVPRTTVDKWVNLALTERDDPDALVDKLILAWTERGQT